MPNITYTVFRRQYYIGAKTLKNNNNWLNISLSDKYQLSYCPTLPVTEIIGKDGCKWTLIGEAIQSLKDQPSPEALLSNLKATDDPYDIYKSWSGRWLLIGRGEVHLDAVGLLGCFYKINGDTIEIASVPSFISGKDLPEKYKIKLGKGIDYFSPPHTGYEDIFKLLPSQILNLDTLQIKPRSLECPIPKLTYTETIQFLADCLTTTLSNAYKKYDKKFVLALTSGYDSRLFMAVLNKAKIPYEAMTFTYPTMRSGDLKIPRQLASISRIKYSLIRRKRAKIENWTKYDVHCAGHAAERDQEFMLYQQFDSLEGDNIVLIRGGGFEIASSKMRTRLPEHILTGKEISTIYGGNALQALSLQSWVNWIKQTEFKSIDWRDRFYWEQRVCGWLSSSEQALDLINIDRIVPSNSFLFYNVMLSLPEKIRLKKTHQIDIVKLLCPELLTVPYNPQMGIVYRNLRRLFARLEAYRKKKMQLLN